IGILLVFAAGYFDFVAKHNIAFIWIAACLSISFAAYRVWARERRSLLAERARNAKPLVRGEIEELYPDRALDTLPEAKGRWDYYLTLKAHLYVANPIHTSVKF